MRVPWGGVFFKSQGMPLNLTPPNFHARHIFWSVGGIGKNGVRHNLQTKKWKSKNYSILETASEVLISFEKDGAKETKTD